MGCEASSQTRLFQNELIGNAFRKYPNGEAFVTALPKANGTCRARKADDTISW